MYRRHIGEPPTPSGLELGVSASWLGISWLLYQLFRKEASGCVLYQFVVSHSHQGRRKTNKHLHTSSVPLVTNTRESKSWTYFTDTLDPVQLPNVRNSKHVMKIRGAVVTGQLVTSSMTKGTGPLPA